ncbi:U8 snoRNA-decapping enzyme [Frankliniella fusca]|uniref:U8 snoRNA-decapping enzyme n=1 Tax=Frankliniella fusca TaxID=407009 RepID=A0AAE1HUN7_9NEOP|nr:U8 snoRNA-decapping enzyme [Frankliniella fusca]
MSPSEFVEVKREDFHKYENEKKLDAGHCMLYARLPSQKFEGYDLRAAVLMQMRFDGHVGFPGGLIEPGEEVVHGLIREMHEEINLNPENNKLSEENHVVSHWSPTEKILLHFYVLEVTPEKLTEIEQGALKSHDYGTEVMGTFRVPLYTMSDGHRGFPTFLRNSFVGNAYQQLRRGLLEASIMSEEEIRAAEAVSRTLSL